jgi:hypothetical protein
VEKSSTPATAVAYSWSGDLTVSRCAAPINEGKEFVISALAMPYWLFLELKPFDPSQGGVPKAFYSR